jgi:hypothetical protein
VNARGDFDQVESPEFLIVTILTLPGKSRDQYSFFPLTLHLSRFLRRACLASKAATYPKNEPHPTIFDL